MITIYTSTSKGKDSNDSLKIFEILDKMEYEFDYVDLSKEKDAIDDFKKYTNNAKSVPQVVIIGDNDHYIVGGLKELEAMVKSGDFKKIIEGK